MHIYQAYIFFHLIEPNIISYRKIHDFTAYPFECLYKLLLGKRIPFEFILSSNLKTKKAI